MATWIPTVENMLEDLLLMLGALSGAQPEVTEVLKPLIAGNLRRVEVYDLGESQRSGLYELSQKTPFRTKLVLTLLEDSTRVGQVDRICRYQIDCELCLSARAAVNADNKETCHA